MTSIVEKVDAYEIGLSDLVVEACRRELAALRLDLRSATSKWTIIIEGSFSIRLETDDDHALPTSRISELVGEPVRLISARKTDGELAVKLGHDWTVIVEPDNDYEAWQIYSSDGERLIAIPGDGVAVWRSAM